MSDQIKRSWQVFINEMIKHGDKISAYKKAYPSCKTEGSAKANATRLLTNATICQMIAKGAAKASEIANGLAIQAAGESEAIVLLSAIEKRQILSQIARGELKIQEHYFTKAGAIPYDRKPNANEIAKAIEIDNKMTGENAPEKVDVNANVETVTRIGYGSRSKD
jgi:hypothetical protein